MRLLLGLQREGKEGKEGSGERWGGCGVFSIGIWSRDRQRHPSRPTGGKSEGKKVRRDDIGGPGPLSTFEYGDNEGQ